MAIARKVRGVPAGPPTFDLEHGGDEHRQFPRAKLTVPFRVWIGEAQGMRFQATLSSTNVSVSGAFLQSTFFLPVGTELLASFLVAADEEPVQARLEVVRQEQPGREGKGRTGMAVRFVEFSGQTEVTLAKLFLGSKLQAFAEVYLASKRARALENELDRCVDALAAWELKKVATEENVWGEAPEERAGRKR